MADAASCRQLSTPLRSTLPASPVQACGLRASAAAGMSSQCPLQTEASSSHAAEIVKITGFDMSAPSGWDRRYAVDGEIQASVARMERSEILRGIDA